MVVGERQLQILGDELDVERPPVASFRSQMSLSPFSEAISRAHRARFPSDLGGVALARQRPSHRLGDVGPEARVAGDKAGAGQRHVLPGLRLVLLIELERCELGRKRTLAPGGPEPHVDIVQAPRFGRRGQGRDQPLRQPRIVERRTERLPAVRLAGVLGENRR